MIDPVTKYAEDVRDGRILAGRAVRLACARHLHDLQRQRTVDFPYWFDQQAAQNVIAFFPTMLTLEDGRPFHLPVWLQFCYGCVFGWKCWDGQRQDGSTVDLDPEFLRRANTRKYRYGFFETSKGSAKTPSGAGIGLYVLQDPAVRFGEIYSAAFDKGQASIILNDAIRMASAEPELNGEDGGIFEISKYNIANESTGSFMRAVSSEHRGKSGPRPFLVLGDEIMEHRDGRVINRLTAGFKHHVEPLALLYTNSGSDRTSLCWEYHQKSLAVLEGTDADEQWFAYVCHLDPCHACFDDGYRQPKDGCEHCDNWTDPGVWQKVAPALGVVIQKKYLQDAVDMALTVPSEYNDKRRLNFCIWTESHMVWISPDRWDACRIETVSQDNAAMRPAAMGLDPASTRDLASAVVAIRHEDAPNSDAPKIEIEGMNDAGERLTLAYTLNYHVELIPFFWIPKETLLERVQKERYPFDVWERKGYLTATPGGAIDHQLVYRDVLDIHKRFKVQTLGMDENSGRFLFMKLRDDGKLGTQIVSVGQGKKLSEAFKFLEMLIAHRRLWHNGHPVLSWCFANAEPKRDRLGALWIEKPSETKRIDGAVAAAMAVLQLMAVPVKRPEPTMFFLGGKA